MGLKPEDKAFQPKEVEKIRKHLWNRIENYTYDVFGYAILFSSYTGIRLGEIPSLKWDDINGTSNNTGYPTVIPFNPNKKSDKNA